MSKLTELKAQAYDCLVQVEQWNKKLREVNQQIAEELNTPTGEPPKEQNE